MMETWERLTPATIGARLDVLREMLGHAAQSYEHPADPGVMTATEVWAVTSPEHLTALCWQDGVCRGVLCGNFTTGPQGEPLLNISWVYFIVLTWNEEDPSKSNRDVLNEYAKSLGVKAVVIESPRPPKVILRWDQDFREVSRIYRKEVA